MTKIIDFSALATDLNQLKATTLAKVGEHDANHIRRMIRWQRVFEFSGRALLMLGFWQPILWLVGVLSLALGKILDNMEIGHNIMHGQYDWMNDPVINSRQFEWDLACDGESWKRVHNYEHHTYTNILGKDRDFGYGLLRLSDDLKWRVNNLWQFITYINLSLLFQWGIAYHELAAERVFFGKKKTDRETKVSPTRLKQRFFKKGGNVILKDYVVFPLLSGPLFLWVLSGNLLANGLRNLWTSSIIFCGHFTGQTQTFTQAECENESQGQWYYRQSQGSSNITGGNWFHLLSGHLSCQIEHHLFPDLPSSRYQEVAPQVQAIFAKHQIPYHTGRFSRQYGSVAKRILRYSMP